MSDKDYGCVYSVPQLLEQPENLCLDGYIKSCCNLVCKKYLGPPDQGHRYHRPLPHSSRKLKGIHSQDAVGSWEPNQSKKLHGTELRKALPLLLAELPRGVAYYLEPVLLPL